MPFLTVLTSHTFRTGVIVGALLLSTAGQAAPPTDKVAQKTIKTLITAIRYKKDDLAAKQLAFRPMVQLIVGDAWGKANAAQQEELADGMETLIRKISFVKGRELFEHLDALLYDKVRIEDGRAVVKTTVVINRNYKKAEIIIEFVLAETAGKWRLVDTILMGQSTAEGIQEDQIEVLMESGGIDAVMSAMRKKISSLS